MFVLTAVQVDLSLGSMPSLVQTPFVISAACSLVKAFGILVKSFVLDTSVHGNKVASCRG